MPAKNLPIKTSGDLPPFSIVLARCEEGKYLFLRAINKGNEGAGEASAWEGGWGKGTKIAGVSFLFLIL